MSERMDHVDGHPPDLHVTASMQLQGRISGIGGLQSQTALVLGQAFEGELPIQHRHHHPPRPWVQAAVHHQQIAVVNAGSEHGFTADAQKKRAGGMLNQLLVEVDSHLHVVIGR